MKKILIPIFACLSFFSCEKLNPNKEAAPLLEEARQAVIDKDFAKAHALIDSIRSAYPRATQVRWARGSAPVLSLMVRAIIAVLDSVLPSAP